MKKKSKIVCDLDDTITINDSHKDYTEKAPNMPVILRLREYQKLGFDIVIFTARNMRTYEGSIGKINKFTLPIIMKWLDKWEVPYDEIIVGKPWCGTDGFYVDDKAIRPDEFAKMNPSEVSKLLSHK
jgi:capsule biosynthesis phosphatase